MAEPFNCPGCGKDMADYMAHEAHYADVTDPRTANGRPPSWPWTLPNRDNALGTVCPWTRDFLSAEWLRRHPQPWTYA